MVMSGHLTILNVRNLSLFILANASAFSFLYYQYSLDSDKYSLDSVQENKGVLAFDTLYPYVGAYAFIDLFFCDSYDFIFHHLSILAIIFYSSYHNVSLEHRFMFSYPLLKTEISSVFYVLKYWIPEKSSLYHVCTILFYVSFLKFRLYDYYDIFYKNILFDLIFKEYSYDLSYLLVLSCYGLFILNLYWFFIINKILYKSFSTRLNLNTEIVCHSICRYIPFLTIPLSLYVYSVPNDKYVYDMMGKTIFIISAYNYHTDMYQRFTDKKVDGLVPTKENAVLFMNYTLTFQLQSFLNVASNYYASNSSFYILLFSSIFHIHSVYLSFYNSLNLFIDYDTIKDNFLNNHLALLSAPIVCDGALIYMNSSYDVAIPLLLIHIVLVLLFVIQPFYKLTPASILFTLMMFNYYVSLSTKMD